METSPTYARKFELGLSFQVQQTNGMSSLVSYDMFRAAVSEFLGMMLFLFNGITVVRLLENKDSMTTETSASIILIAFTFGLSIFALVYVLAEVSGANLNPAVSIGLLVGKRITVERFVIYVIAQIAGAIAGAGIATTFLDSTEGGYNKVADHIDTADAFGGEVLCTFLLVLTVFAATDGQLGHKNAFISPLLPWAISMAVFLGHTIMIPIDGCSLNPARSLASAVTNNEWDDHWVFWIGPLLGGVLAAIVWETIFRPDQPVDRPIDQPALAKKYLVTATATA